MKRLGALVLTLVIPGAVLWSCASGTDNDPFGNQGSDGGSGGVPNGSGGAGGLGPGGAGGDMTSSTASTTTSTTSVASTTTSVGSGGCDPLTCTTMCLANPNAPCGMCDPMGQCVCVPFDQCFPLPDAGIDLDGGFPDLGLPDLGLPDVFP